MECPEGYVSGEALSELLGVSRTAVWKYIKEIKEDGYEIKASSKKGYRLGPGGDILNSFEVMHGLDTAVMGRKVEYFKEIDSTNTYAKKLAGEGCPDGTIVLAERQTAGKGRLGRAWASAGEKGIWMSVVLRPGIPPEEVQMITLGASIAVVKAVKEVTGIQTGIKWPNDIVTEGKKVCGILTEMSCEQDRVNFVVVGIGLNVNHKQGDFPDEIIDRAVSLRMLAEGRQTGIEGEADKAKLKRSSIIKEIARQLEKVYFDINEGRASGIIDQWKSYSATLGKKVRVSIKGVEYTGTAADITTDGKLVVDCDDGERREVVSGEVMVRGILGYV